MRHVRAAEGLQARHEPRRDPGSAAELAPWALPEDRRAPVDALGREEAQELRQRTRRGVRRQQLVGDVGEHDEPHRLVRRDEAAHDGPDSLEGGPGDARRHVEDDDTGLRADREHSSSAAPGGAREENRARERRREGEREADANHGRALGRLGELGQVPEAGCAAACERRPSHRSGSPLRR